MSRIIFHKITFQNFMSYGNYDSSIELDKNKLTLIQGENGAGKTTALLALSYNLFGKTFNKALKSSLINKKNKKGLLTRSWFTIGDKEYFVERGEKPSIFRVAVNGREMDIDGDSREFQKKFETEILQFDLKTFTRLICLGYNYIRFFELSSPERREFIESVLDLGTLSDMSKQVKEFQKQDSDDLIKYNLLLNGKISNKEIYEKQLETLSKDNELIIKQQNDKILALTQANNDIKSKILSEKDEYEKLKTDIDILKKQIEDDKIKYRNIIIDINKYQQLVDNNNNLIKFFTEHDKCPTCNQDIDKTFSDTQIASLTTQNFNTTNKINELKSESNGINEFITVNNNDLIKLNNILQERVKLITSLKSDYKNNDVIINECKVYIEKSKNNSNITELKDNIQKCVDYINDIQAKISKLQHRIAIYKSTIDILGETGVKKALIDNYIDIINAKVNEYLEDFGCTFDFSMDSEFNETINLDFHDDVKYENLSAGQKQRLDISIFLAFREIAQLRSKTSANILLLDEILDSNLDDDGVCKIIDILLKQSNINILAISHNNTCKELCENVITIKKEKYGFSRIYK